MTTKIRQPKVDTRGLSVGELRLNESDGKLRITGYAAVFNSLSEDLGGFREIIRPGAFAAALAKSPDVRALIDHISSLIIGRTTAGTLLLTEDSRGLRYDIDPPDTQAARDLATNIKIRNVSGSSFRFYMHDDPNRGQTWRSEPTGVIREITEFAAIDDVSIVTYPAYRATDVSVRSMDAFKAATVKSPNPWGYSAHVRLRLAEAGL